MFPVQQTYRELKESNGIAVVDDAIPRSKHATSRHVHHVLACLVGQNLVDCVKPYELRDIEGQRHWRSFHIGWRAARKDFGGNRLTGSERKAIPSFM